MAGLASRLTRPLIIVMLGTSAVPPGTSAAPPGASADTPPGASTIVPQEPELAQGAAAVATDPFAHPADLEPDVRFWIRVYTEVTTDQGLLHDDRNLGLVYEVLRFDPGASPAQRERRVLEAKARYAALLRRFANGDIGTLSAHERRILRSFGESPAPERFRDAIERIRFQLGQADRFHEGLVRAAAWEPLIARTLAQHGVPAEIAALPHVESSFNLAAYSKVGAAGLWQFMPSTAKRFMRVDSLVDQRLDPYSSTEAAANLMLYNYRLLGTWPLAVTAYNHGPGGLRRAQEDLGTSDIAVIVRRYQGATFGFASRNFYVAFLAALEVDRNAELYFGPITHLPDTTSTTVELPDYIPVDTLAKAFKVDMGALRVLNPALRPPIWSGIRLVPRGYTLRVPGTPHPSEIAAAWARLPPSQRYLSQRGDPNHRMRRGETLARVAAANGVSVARLLAANGLGSAHVPVRGELLRIPMPASRADTGGAATPEIAGIVSASAPPSSPAPTARSAPPAPLASPAPPATDAPPGMLPEPIAASVPPPVARLQKNAPVAAPAEPVSERQTERSALLPVEAPTGNSDATDYSVAADDTVIVRADETIGHYANWTGVDAMALRALNQLRKNSLVTVGRKFKLDLSRVTAAQFVAARRAYHQRLQDAFFSTHRIAGTENYVVKHGESLWSIARQHSDLPAWLVSQYNPDMSFGDMRPGTTITLPRVVAINRQ